MTTATSIEQELRQAGFELHNPKGSLVLLGAGIHGGQFVRVAGIRKEYLLGTELDADAEMVAIFVLTQLAAQPLSSVQEDIADLLKKNRARLALSKGAEGCEIVTDMATPHGALVEERVRSHFRLRTGGQELKPRIDQRGHWEIDEETLIAALAARVSAGQVVPDPRAVGGASALREALRAASDTQLGASHPATRIIAWASEVALRPLISPTNKLAPLPTPKGGVKLVFAVP